MAIIGDVLANSHWATIHGHHYPSCPREPPRRFSQSRITNRESLQVRHMNQPACEGRGGGGLTIIIHAATSELVLLLTTSFRLSPAASRQQKILSLGPHIICFGHGPPLVLLNGPLEMGEEDAAVEGVAVGQ